MGVQTETIAFPLELFNQRSVVRRDPSWRSVGARDLRVHPISPRKVYRRSGGSFQSKPELAEKLMSHLKTEPRLSFVRVNPTVVGLNVYAYDYGYFRQ